MRLSVASLRRMIKGKLQVEFVPQDLTSYSGLELLRRYLRQLDLPHRLRAACASTGGMYRSYAVLQGVDKGILSVDRYSAMA